MVNVSRPDAPSSQSHRAEGTASAQPATTPLPLFVLPPHPQRVVISTEAAHAFVSSAVEKSASLPPPCPGQRGVLAFVLAVACSFVVIQQGICCCSVCCLRGKRANRTIPAPRRGLSRVPRSAQSWRGMRSNLNSSNLAQKTHVKPQNHLNHSKKRRSSWHFSLAQPAIMNI